MKTIEQLQAEIDKVVIDPDTTFVSANHWDVLEPLFREAQKRHGVKP